MASGPATLLLRRVARGVLLTIVGTIVCLATVWNVWQASGPISLGLSLVVTVLSLAAIGYSLVYCWYAMSDADEHEYLQSVLDQIDSTDE